MMRDDGFERRGQEQFNHGTIFLNTLHILYWLSIQNHFAYQIFKMSQLSIPIPDMLVLI